MGREVKGEASSGLWGSVISQHSILQHQQTKKYINGRKCFTPNITTPVQQTIETLYQSRLYAISVNRIEETECQVTNCAYQTNQTNCKSTHFQNKYNDYWLVVQEEGALPRCDACEIFQCSV
jgi:hypothetical protein